MKVNLKNLKKIIDEVTIYAAAMSFYTLFSLIPIILLVLTLFSSTPFFSEFYDKLHTFLVSNILPSNQTQIKTYLDTFLANSSQMGFLGGIYIIITSILFFDNYETIISKIYNQEKRDFWEKLKLYWTMITLFPILFSIAIYLSIKMENLLHFSLAFLLPFIIMWLVFFLAYKLTLEVKSEISSLVVSFFVSVTFFVAKNIFIYYITFNKTYKSLYGSISILMFIFLWIYLNWMIYIVGIYLTKYIDNKMLQKFPNKD